MLKFLFQKKFSLITKPFVTRLCSLKKFNYSTFGEVKDKAENKEVKEEENFEKTINYYNHLLNVCIKNNTDGKETIEAIENSKLVKDQTTYNLLLKYYLLTNNEKKIKSLMVEMNGLGVEKDIHFYNVILGFFLFKEEEMNSKEIEKINELIELIYNSKTMLNQDTYSLLLKHYLTTRDVEKLKELKKEMEVSGIEKDINYYNIYLNYLIDNNDETEIENIIEEVEKKKIKKNPGYHNLLSKYYSSRVKNDLKKENMTISIDQMLDLLKK
jgi:pentatricopeptide repeat protein